MSKKLANITLYHVNYIDETNKLSHRIVFSFGEIRREENSVIITDGQEVSMQFDREITIQETINILLSAVHLLKNSIL